MEEPHRRHHARRVAAAICFVSLPTYLDAHWCGLTKCKASFLHLPSARHSNRHMSIYCRRHAASEVWDVSVGQKLLRDDLDQLRKTRPRDHTRREYLFARKGSTYTHLWDVDRWERHCSRWRYYYHIIRWSGSALARIILPIVIVFTLWAALYTWVIRHDYLSRVEFHMHAMVPLTVAISTSLSLLLTLRANQAISRLLEARVAWGISIKASREMASLASAYIAPQSPSCAFLIGRHLSLFGWCMKGVLRNEDDGDVVKLMLPPHEAAFILSNPSRPLGLLSRLHHIVSRVTKQAAIPDPVHKRFLEIIAELTSGIETCLRILSSPTPPTYTRHCSRVLLVWLFMMPVALESAGYSIGIIVITTFMCSYALIGIDEIGVQIEAPHRLLPMQGLSTVLMEGVINEIAPHLPHPALDDIIVQELEETKSFSRSPY